VALLALLLLAGGGVAAYLLTRPVKKIVPVVVREQVSLAQAQVQNAGFTPNLIYRTDSHQAGTVINQEPLGLTKADEGSTVTLTVSQGPGNVSVPSVTDLPQGQAVREIKRAQLKIGRVQSESSDTVARGSATRTDPGAGVSLPVGSAVTLFVSSGKPQVNVPDVTNETQAAATASLKNAGFSVTTSTQTSTTVPPGDVISQSPSGGSSAAPNSNVNIVIAKAPTTANVPNVKGETASAASSTLTGAGFKVTQQTKNVTVSSQDGVVIDQTPAANTTANKNSTVTIVVGHFKAPPTPTTPTTPTTPSTTTTTPKP